MCFDVAIELSKWLVPVSTRRFSRIVRALSAHFHTLSAADSSLPAFLYNKNKDCIEFEPPEHIAD
jgi:hypothetical protein